MAWRVEGETQPEIMDGKDVICDFRGSTFAPVIDFEHARVMAAAPETTDSLEEICNLIAAGNDLTFAPLAAAIIKARAAIAKARGATA